MPKITLIGAGSTVFAKNLLVDLFNYPDLAGAAVLAVARFVAPPVAEEGAAQMIERIALDGWQAPAGRGSAGSATAAP